MPRRRGLTRSAVIHAAAELLDEDPGKELTLARVAQRVDVRTPSLYNHVESLDDLFHGIAVIAVRELGDGIGKAAIGKSGDDAIEAIAREYRRFALERPGLYPFTQRAPKPGQIELEEVAAEILRVLDIILEPYALDQTERVYAIRALRSMVHGFVSLELNGGFGLPVDIEESFSWLVDGYLAQLRGARTT
jgi:AcrR family transcriptional regulator